MHDTIVFYILTNLTKLKLESQGHMRNPFIQKLIIKAMFLSITLLSSIAITSCTQLGLGKSKVTFKTTAGDFVVELYPDKAPNTVKNFLSYVKEGRYKDTIFHRVIKDFVVQGGGFNEQMEAIDLFDPIENEADNGLQNNTYTLAMARTNDPHSASSQFFINLKDNNFLNYKSKDSAGWGYCIFGKVIEGMEIIDKIGQVETTTVGQFQDVPKTPIIVTEALL